MRWAQWRKVHQLGFHLLNNNFAHLNDMLNNVTVCNTFCPKKEIFILHQGLLEIFDKSSDVARLSLEFAMSILIVGNAILNFHMNLICEETFGTRPNLNDDPELGRNCQCWAELYTLQLSLHSKLCWLPLYITGPAQLNRIPTMHIHYFLHDRWCTTKRSGKNVRPHRSHGTSCAWDACQAASFIASIS